MTGSRRRLRALLTLAGAAVAWERLAPRLWPAAAVAGVFIAVAWLDLLPLLPPWLHAVVLAATLAALAVVLWRARGGFRAVGRDAAQRRLERDSGLADRPLAALDDRLAGGRDDPAAEALWHRHRAQMAGRLSDLKVRWPQVELDRIEPWGIRAGVVLLLAVGLAAAWDEPWERLARAVDPGLGFAARPAPLIEVWISPPTYTRAAPHFLTLGSEATAAAGTLAVPQGSTVIARVTGIRGEATLLVGEARVPFSALDGSPAAKRAFGVETMIDTGDRLAVTAGRRTLASWPLRIIPDRPPAIALTAPPAERDNGGFAFDYAASDDYGVRAAEAILRRTDGTAGEIRLELPLAAADATAVSGESRHDLAAHRWAGETVVAELLARDDLGQTGTSEAVSFGLPERRFSHPVARAIVAARKHLVTDTAASRQAAAEDVQAIAAYPEAFAGDVVVSLALAVAGGRLRYDASDGAVDSVRDLLWSTALRLEEGEVPAAERALAEARRNLMEALARDAPPEEIERRMDALEAALQRYLEALAAEMARRGETTAEPDPQLMPTAPADFAEMLDTVRQMLRAGARDSAERMLAEMQRMLDQLRDGLPAAGFSQAMREAGALLDALRDLKDRQQSLLDQTFERLRRLRDRLDPSARDRPPAGGGPGAKPGIGVEAQQQLRRELAELTARAQRLLGAAPGALPGELSEADQAMRSAGRSLEQNRLGEGANRQGQAVDALGRAIDALGQALAQALGTGNMVILGPGSRPGGGPGDAFGRQPPGGRRGAAEGEVPIPDAATLRRAQEILNELRRRAGEPARPVIERDYIDRMLRRD